MSDTVQAAVEALRGGRLVILPTETVYGLAADAGDAAAVAAIFEAKGRPRFNPLISHVADAQAARALAQFDAQANALADAFWPGPLTLVLPVLDNDRISDLARAGLDSVAVRVPGHPLAREVLKAFGGPVVAPSANRSGRPSPTTHADAVEETGASAAASLDGEARLLRPGAVTRAEIEAVVGPVRQDGEGHRSPGRLALHYAPDAPVRIEAAEAKPGEIWLGFGPEVGEFRWSLSSSGDLAEAAANLFRRLREADRERPAGIAVAPIPDHGLG